MSIRKFITPLLTLVLLCALILTVRAVPPQPTTIYGKVQVGGIDVPDGTQITAWMGSSEAVVADTPLSFPGIGVSITFATACSGSVMASQQAGGAEVVSQDGYTSVYVVNARGPSDWIPPDNPENEGLTITLKISDTVAATTTWSMGSSIPLSLTVDLVEGNLPYTPVHVNLLGQVWDIGIDCTGFVASATFTYDETWLQDVAETDIVGMARYDDGYNRWEYYPGTVDIEANTVTVSNVTAFSKWKVLASTPPKVVADLNATPSGTDLALTWFAVDQDIKGQTLGGVNYNIYRSADSPYFTPGDTPYHTTSGTFYTDAGVVGDPTSNYYYVITAVDAMGKESAISDRVGEFDFELQKTTGTDYTWLALPLENGAVAMASDLEQYIEASCSQPVSILSIARWNAPGQQMVQYTTIPFSMGDFALQTGQAYRVEGDVSGVDSCIGTVTGYVPRRGALGFELVTTTGTDYSWISVPLDEDTLSTASDLEQSIETETGTTVLSICRWNAISQQFNCYTTVPIPMGDFAIENGHPYRIEVNTPTVWP